MITPPASKRLYSSIISERLMPGALSFAARMWTIGRTVGGQPEPSVSARGAVGTSSTCGKLRDLFKTPWKVLRAMEYGGVYVASAELENPGVSRVSRSFLVKELLEELFVFFVFSWRVLSARQLPDGSSKLRSWPFPGFAR